MNYERVAIYARVSSKQQAEAGTIESQLAALRERVEQDGCQLAEELVLVCVNDFGTTLAGI
jgi:site-specific DNA recombinase